MKERTEAQKQASRDNGKLSQGPITELGKRRASRNRLRHGLLARAIVLDNERKSNFTLLTRRFYKAYHPRNEHERAILDDMAQSFWKLRRAWAVETRLMNQKLADPNATNLDWTPLSSPNMANASPFDELDASAFADPAAALHAASDEDYIREMDRIAEAWSALAAHPGFTSVLRIKTQLHNSFLRGLRHLQQVRLDNLHVERLKLRVEQLRWQNDRLREKMGKP